MFLFGMLIISYISAIKKFTCHSLNSFWKDLVTIHIEVLYRKGSGSGRLLIMSWWTKLLALKTKEQYHSFIHLRQPGPWMGLQRVLHPILADIEWRPGHMDIPCTALVNMLCYFKSSSWHIFGGTISAHSTPPPTHTLTLNMYLSPLLCLFF